MTQTLPPETASPRALTPERLITFALLLLLAARFAFFAQNSFSWQPDGDLSFLFYIARLMNEHDYIPYRDIHETSFFGTFIFYSLLTKIIGYSTTAFFLFDLFCVFLLTGLTCRIMKPFGLMCGLIASLTFLEVYYQFGPSVHLQRDFLGIIPAAAALVIACHPGRKLLRYFWIGLLFGISASIKPQFALGAPIIILFAIHQQQIPLTRFSTGTLKAIVISLAGFFSCLTMGYAWLMWHGVADEFTRMLTEYLPHYNSINGRNYERLAVDALDGAIRWYGGRLSTWLPPLIASLIVFTIAGNQKYKPLVLTLVVLWLVSMLYVPMAGKYWHYHKLPYFYFLSLSLSVIFCPRKENYRARWWLAGCLVIWLLYFYVHTLHFSPIKPAIKHNLAHAERTETSKKILVDYLTKNLREGDRVLTNVTHTRGPIFPALLQTGTLPASPYLENYLFYHDTHTEYVQSARKSFIENIQKKPPDFIISIPNVFGFHGKHVDNTFPEFKNFMQQNYTIDKKFRPEGASATETFIIRKLKN
jgi:hypothetical protein